MGLINKVNKERDNDFIYNADIAIPDLGSTFLRFLAFLAFWAFWPVMEIFWLQTSWLPVLVKIYLLCGLSFKKNLRNDYQVIESTLENKDKNSRVSSFSLKVQDRNP